MEKGVVRRKRKGQQQVQAKQQAMVMELGSRLVTQRRKVSPQLQQRTLVLLVLPLVVQRKEKEKEKEKMRPSVRQMRNSTR